MGPELEKTAFIIPALNEEKTVGTVVSELRNFFPLSEVVVVDDASEDQTPTLAERSGAKVISHPFRMGAWAATQTGLLYAYRKGFEYFVTLDADGQHLPREAPKLLEPLYRNEAEVVIGSFTERGGLFKKLAWKFFQKLSGIKVEDLTSGFRAYSRKAVSVLLSSDFLVTDTPDFLILFALKENSMSFLEVEVKMLPRKEGKSRVFPSSSRILSYVILSTVLSISKRCLRWQSS